MTKKGNLRIYDIRIRIYDLDISDPPYIFLLQRSIIADQDLIRARMISYSRQVSARLQRLGVEESMVTRGSK